MPKSEEYKAPKEVEDMRWKLDVVEALDKTAWEMGFRKEHPEIGRSISMDNSEPCLELRHNEYTLCLWGNASDRLIQYLFFDPLYDEPKYEDSTSLESAQQWIRNFVENPGGA